MLVKQVKLLDNTEYSKQKDLVILTHVLLDCLPIRPINSEFAIHALAKKYKETIILHFMYVCERP